MIVVRKRHHGRFLADPDPLELAAYTQAFVLVADGGRSGQQLLEPLVAVEPRGPTEERLEESARGIGNS